MDIPPFLWASVKEILYYDDVHQYIILIIINQVVIGFQM